MTEKGTSTLWRAMLRLSGLPTGASIDQVHHAVPVVGRGTIQRIHEGAGSQFRTVQRIADHFQVPAPVLLSASVPESYRLSEPIASSDYAREGEPKSYGPSLDHALPVVLDAMARAPERAKLRAALLALLEDDSPAYRARIAELLRGV